MSEDIRRNGKYVIISAMKIGEGEIVLAKNEKTNVFATWRCKNGNNYYNGNYFSKETAAQKDFLYRCLSDVKNLADVEEMRLEKANEILDEEMEL